MISYQITIFAVVLNQIDQNHAALSNPSACYTCKDAYFDPILLNYFVPASLQKMEARGEEEPRALP